MASPNPHRTARQNWWEVIYSPNAKPREFRAYVDAVDHSSGPADALIEGSDVVDGRGILANGTTKGRTFRGCDFRGTFAHRTFNGCDFTNCDFGHTRFVDVKFSRCEFNTVSFSYTTFDRCQFIECRFSTISISGEHLVMEKSSVHASAFIDAISTNEREEEYPEDERKRGVTLAYQQYRLAKTVAKAAQIVYNSTREEADQDLYYDAFGTMVVRSLRWKAMEGTYLEERRNNEGPALVTLNPSRRNKLLRGLHWLELWLSQLSGFLTSWGKSIVRPAVVGFLLLAAGFVAYGIGTGDWWYALARSIDVTTVAGYTKHPATGHPDASTWLVVFSYAHLLASIYWYSLIAAVLVKRILR